MCSHQVDSPNKHTWIPLPWTSTRGPNTSCTWTHKTSSKWPTQSGAQRSQTDYSHSYYYHSSNTQSQQNVHCCHHNKKVTHTVVPYHNMLLESSKFNAARTNTRDQSRLEKPHPQSQLVWPLPHKLNYCLHLANNSHLWFTMGLTSPQHLMVTEHTKLTSWTFTSR